MSTSGFQIALISVFMSQCLGVYCTHTHTKAALQTVKNEDSYSPL